MSMINVSIWAKHFVPNKYQINLLKSPSPSSLLDGLK